MDRRTKFILFIIGAIVLFGLVVWLIVLPTLAPLFPAKPVVQPPSLPSTLTPPVVQPGASQPTDAGTTGAPGVPGIATFTPRPTASPDAERIASLSARAGILSERVESGSSANGFSNLDDAAIDVSPSLAGTFRTMKLDLQKKYPSAGPTYFTIARRLLEIPESETITGLTFKVAVQMQIQVRDGDKTSTIYRESTVTFTRSGDEWIASGYRTKAFTP